jgi:hypothetical protein
MHQEKMWGDHVANFLLQNYKEPTSREESACCAKTRHVSKLFQWLNSQKSSAYQALVLF